MLAPEQATLVSRTMQVCEYPPEILVTRWVSPEGEVTGLACVDAAEATTTPLVQTANVRSARTARVRERCMHVPIGPLLSMIGGVYTAGRPSTGRSFLFLTGMAVMVECEG